MDEFTGRTMADRRWGEGLHQAVEAKEGLPIQNETVTLASITYQVSCLLRCEVGFATAQLGSVCGRADACASLMGWLSSLPTLLRGCDHGLHFRQASVTNGVTWPHPEPLKQRTGTWL